MALTEPPLKKPKLEKTKDSMLKSLDRYIETLKNSTKPLKIIIDEDLFSPIPLVKVYTGHIKDPRLISKTVLTLNETLPLKELQHLKRVRKREIIICPVQSLNGTSVEEYLQKNVHELENVFECFKEVDVPSLPPKVTCQYKEANKIWSVNFHPNKYMESIVSNTLFKESEIQFHYQVMALCFEVAKWCIIQKDIQIDDKETFKDINVAIVVDPSVNSIVAIAIDNRRNHPMQHAAMLAIDSVAKTQNGGAWTNTGDTTKTVTDIDKEGSVTTDVQTKKTLSGIDKDLHTYLSTSDFKELKFGARQYLSKRELADNNADHSNAPYLCTGYYIYVLREPCIMCAMGLTHARISRVFYCFNNELRGALGSRTNLHLNPALNHRFEAFTGFL